ncbi:Tim17a2 [Drosophila busckii]|uniref:Tim17a2 n=1 Tax=Drosophila busckii TaxID=30019 RepID=A0A0M4EEY6_DROBS|nr:probable mitochondrial import inner membrane translocase subunit Tim17 3 [Drosophila busckii]ALC46641.1 Tim17a2 [Drosophila busckii]
MTMVEYNRQPCPIRIVEDCGCTFMMGCIGGSILQYVRGFRNAPAGIMRGLYGGLDSVKLKTPAIAGSFAIWGATFSAVDCSMVYYRQREDSWNSIVSGAATGGILAARNGLKAMGNGAIVGGLVLAMIEGAGVAVATIYAAQPNGSDEESKPQRPQWEVVDNVTNPNSNENALAELESLLEKCNAYKQIKSIPMPRERRARYRLRENTMNKVESKANNQPTTPSLLELVKQANIFNT